MAQYTEMIDGVIYKGRPLHSVSDDQWPALAMAIIDQSGANIKTQGRIKDILTQAGLMDQEGEEHGNHTTNDRRACRQS